MRRKRFVLALMTALTLSAGLLAGPAYADGSVRKSVCGAVGTFKTIGTKAQTHYIVTPSGQQTADHNGGCFGIAPNGTVWWTPHQNPRWREMPGNGVAHQVGYSYVGTTCPPGQTCVGNRWQTVTVLTSAGDFFAQQWDPDLGRWDGHWHLNYT